MKTRIIIFSILFIRFFGFSQNSPNYETITAKKFSEKIKNTTNPQILDVRSPEEFSSEHLDNAINTNWNNDNFESQVGKIDKSKPVFVYCMSGGRSAKASEKLHQLGFKEIYNLQGGILKWNSAGLEKPSDKIIGVCPQEYAELLKSDKKVLVDFYAEWCEPCQKMKPYLLQMQKDLANNIVIIRLNADENKTIMKELKIDELPVLLLYENKELKWKNIGFISEDDLKKHL